MEKNIDVTALGELLIDFTNNGVSAQGNPLFEANPGGAPCNVLSLLTKLGHPTAFIGKVGKDSFGDILQEAIEEIGISAEGLARDAEIPTTLAFVHTLADGDRAFSFYRKPGADMRLSKEDVRFDLIERAKIFHFGTLSMTHEPCREATKAAIDAAKRAGALLSFDPNLRESLWDGLSQAKEQIAYGLGVCDILKISDNEILWFTGKESIDEATDALLAAYPIPLVLVSLGKEGSIACQGGRRVKAAAYPQNAIETTGAGDTFCGSILHFVLTRGWKEDYTEDELKEALSFANAAASIVTTRKGALRAMPTREEILSVRRQRSV